MAETIFSGDNEIVGQTEKEPVSRHTGTCVEFRGEFLGVCDRTEPAVVDEVAFLGNKRPVLILHAQDGASAQFFQECSLRLAVERKYLDGKRVLGAEPVGHFRFVDHDDFAARGLRDDFLVEKRTSSAFDQVELRIDLVRAVDGDVDGDGTLGSEQGQACCGRSTCDFGRCGESPYSRQPSCTVSASDFANGMDGGRAGAQSHGHSRFDQLHGMDRSLFFQFVL